MRISSTLTVKIEKNEISELKKMSSERGEISKSDLVVYIKQSKMWKGIMESKPKSCSQSKPISKVKIQDKWRNMVWLEGSW